MKLYFTLEIGDKSQNRNWILISSVILIQLQKLFYMLSDVEYIYRGTRNCNMIRKNLYRLVVAQCTLYIIAVCLSIFSVLLVLYTMYQDHKTIAALLQVGCAI